MSVLAGPVIGFRIEEGAGELQQGIGLALFEGRVGGDLGIVLRGVLLRELIRTRDGPRGDTVPGAVE